MFIKFFYLLRERGLKVSLNEWMSLMDALEQGLGQSSLSSFYFLCRAVLIKTESDYDKFDMAFAEFFHGVKTPEEIPEEVWEWMDKDLAQYGKVIDEKMKALLGEGFDFDKLQEMLEQRLKEQKEEHHGGNHWIGTGGTSPFGHGGYNPAGIRIGGESRHRSAVQIAGERNFKDFREDNTLDIRNFQMAFRKLRQFSSKNEGPKTELDIDQTIQETCNNAGNLKLVFDRPRKNTMKVLLLFDSGGTMARYSQLCSQLFQAAHQSNHFKSLKAYYFHNCFYQELFTDPSCRKKTSIDTNWVLRNLDSDYRVIIVGDGCMAPSELLRTGGASYRVSYNQEPGITWLKRVKQKYPHVVWINPLSKKVWDIVYGNVTLGMIRDIFPMYELTVEGLDQAIKKLLVSR
ncbi:MAG: VWA domain-containing protein [Firmicutes bacterium]|nr:VWA domain-containing protein [Bacillota bacterium]